MPSLDNKTSKTAHFSSFIEKKSLEILLLRIGAKIVDLGLGALSFFIAFPFGVFPCLFFLLLMDALNNGQSPGKILFGLKCLPLSELGGPFPLWKISCLRNFPFLALPLVFSSFLPLFFLLFLSVYVVLEIFFIYKTGHRIIDIFSRGQVVNDFTFTSKNEESSSKTGLPPGQWY